VPHRVAILAERPAHQRDAAAPFGRVDTDIVAHHLDLLGGRAVPLRADVHPQALMRDGDDLERGCAPLQFQVGLDPAAGIDQLAVLADDGERRPELIEDRVLGERDDRFALALAGVDGPRAVAVASRNSRIASSPPAEAPMPTTGTWLGRSVTDSSATTGSTSLSASDSASPLVCSFMLLLDLSVVARRQLQYQRPDEGARRNANETFRK